MHFEIGDRVRVALTEGDYDYKTWNGFVSRVKMTVDMGWEEEQYIIDGCLNIAWRPQDIVKTDEV